MLQWQMFPDLIYIDASHDAVDVIQDLEHFWFLLSCGGLMTGDDYTWPQVKAAVQAFACQHELDIKLTEVGENNIKWSVGPKVC